LSVRTKLSAAARYRAEIATSAALVSGWAFLTSAVSHYVSAGVVWRVSAGLFLLSLCGWRLLAKIAGHGLYKLTRD
jgi:hypothetical protein